MNLISSLPRTSAGAVWVVGWGRRTGGGQWRCSRGCGWGPRCVLMGKRIGWTRIIVCHRAHVITRVQTHLICCLTCLLHGVVMHGCVTPTRCVHGCVTPTRCMMLTRLIAFILLTSTCLPTTPYNRFTCVACIACIVQGQPTELFNSFQGRHKVGVDLGTWFALCQNLQM